MSQAQDEIGVANQSASRHNLTENQLKELKETIDHATAVLEEAANKSASAEHKVTGKSAAFGLAKLDLRELAEDVQEVKHSIEEQEEDMKVVHDE